MNCEIFLNSLVKAKCTHTHQYHQPRNMTGDFLTAKEMKIKETKKSSERKITENNEVLPGRKQNN